MIFYEPRLRDRKILPHDPFKALIAPRPIGWVSTKSADGEINLAPYSFFNALSDNPPLLAFSSLSEKDSLTFARETREFVWSMATWLLRDAMNKTSAPLKRGESEFDYAGLAMAPSKIVGPPRVALSPSALECKVTEIIQLRNIDGDKTDNWLTIGQVVGVHIDPAFIKDGVVQTAEMKPITRCGYLSDYAVFDETFQMERPRQA